MTVDDIVSSVDQACTDLSLGSRLTFLSRLVTALDKRHRAASHALVSRLGARREVQITYCQTHGWPMDPGQWTAEQREVLETLRSVTEKIETKHTYLGMGNDG